jgi:Ala-tRNA(Pro) deacylase
MPMLAKLKEVLDQAKVSYEVFNHPRAFTAQEIAATQHITGRAMAKVVILKVDGSYVMAVVPSNRLVSLGIVRANLGAKEVELVPEERFAALFPDCEIGAMPPFGNLFGLPVYLDPALERYDFVYFNAGNHLQTVRLKLTELKRLVKPRMVSLTEGRKKKAA